MNLSNLRLRNPSSWTMFIFGVLALLLGLLGIIRPEIMLELLGLEDVAREVRVEGDYTLMFITASSMASFNMGVYYVLASLNNMRKFYWWTVPFRMVTFIVFTLAVANDIAPDAFMGVAAWELIGALCTGGALLYENSQNTA